MRFEVKVRGLYGGAVRRIWTLESNRSRKSKQPKQRSGGEGGEPQPRVAPRSSSRGSSTLVSAMQTQSESEQHQHMLYHSASSIPLEAASTHSSQSATSKQPRDEEEEDGLALDDPPPTAVIPGAGPINYAAIAAKGAAAAGPYASSRRSPVVAEDDIEIAAHQKQRDAFIREVTNVPQQLKSIHRAAEIVRPSQESLNLSCCCVTDVSRTPADTGATASPTPCRRFDEAPNRLNSL